ncbi:MAG: GNAT family N-acetyltransferase [Pseudomonadota bacterium]
MIRPARPSDAEACAAIWNAWVDATPWMPRIHPHEDVVRHYRETVLPTHRVWILGQRAEGHLVLNERTGTIGGLFLAPEARGRGLGRALLDEAKAVAARLDLWTFVANTGARRFYEANGFRRAGGTDGDNEEGLPDIRYEWAAP